jgi:hypothetical protein
MRGDLIPVIVAAFVAVAGTAGIVLSFGPGENSQQGNAMLITAAAVSRAGAIETPTEPSAIAGSSTIASGF